MRAKVTYEMFLIASEAKVSGRPLAQMVPSLYQCHAAALHAGTSYA